MQLFLHLLVLALLGESNSTSAVEKTANATEGLQKKATTTAAPTESATSAAQGTNAAEDSVDVTAQSKLTKSTATASVNTSSTGLAAAISQSPQDIASTSSTLSPSLAELAEPDANAAATGTSEAAVSNTAPVTKHPQEISTTSTSHSPNLTFQPKPINGSAAATHGNIDARNRGTAAPNMTATTKRAQDVSSMATTLASTTGSPGAFSTTTKVSALFSASGKYTALPDASSNRTKLNTSAMHVLASNIVLASTTTSTVSSILSSAVGSNDPKASLANAAVFAHASTTLELFGDTASSTAPAPSESGYTAETNLGAMASSTSRVESSSASTTSLGGVTWSTSQAAFSSTSTAPELQGVAASSGFLASSSPAGTTLKSSSTSAIEFWPSSDREYNQLPTQGPSTEKTAPDLDSLGKNPAMEQPWLSGNQERTQPSTEKPPAITGSSQELDSEWGQPASDLGRAWGQQTTTRSVNLAYSRDQSSPSMEQTAQYLGSLEKNPAMENPWLAGNQEPYEPSTANPPAIPGPSQQLAEASGPGGSWGQQASGLGSAWGQQTTTRSVKFAHWRDQERQQQQGPPPATPDVVGSGTPEEIAAENGNSFLSEYSMLFGALILVCTGLGFYYICFQQGREYFRFDGHETASLGYPSNTIGKKNRMINDGL